jgi:hypothetical protein
MSNILDNPLYVFDFSFLFLFWMLTFFFKGIGLWIYHGSSWSIQRLSVQNDSTGEGPLHTSFLPIKQFQHG